ncbi:peptide MFS transporter [Aquimarina celericrescens]|uniref:Peptide MFS transporter n=1 Tax=Aquimarina celericrescens TaxID=1964542 RepID=A0ABW5B0F2_9FLAO|nr:peptide MFS transporter [Aquimarina celericrescens]
MANTVKAAHQKELFGHPVGLYILFFTEMWERFSYYGMRGILVLYLTAKTVGDNPGLGWLDAEALSLYGWYTMLVYVASIPGGIIADKILGQKRSVMIGGLLLVAGHGILSIEEMWAFYTGLALIIAGVGMLKPNISTLVGGLYKQGDERRDKGFSIFYIGINVGAALASLVVAVVADAYGWHAGFGLAAIGMVLGQTVYMLGQKYITHVGNKPIKTIDKEDDHVSIGKIFRNQFSSTVPLAVTFILAIVSSLVAYLFIENQKIAYILFFIFLSLVVGMMITIYRDLKSKVEKDRYIVLLLSFIIVIVFWGAFEQAGGLMNLYAENRTNRMFLGYQIPAAVFQFFNPFYIILFAVPVANFWLWWKNRGKEASSLFKMANGVIIMGLGFVFMVFASMQYEKIGESAMYWLALAYLFHTIGELCASPVALSFITKLAPVRYGALMMGVYFAATGLGNKVAGLIGESASEAGELTIFSGITIFCVIFGILVIMLLKPLKRLTHKAEDLKPNTYDEETEGFELADTAE